MRFLLLAPLLLSSAASSAIAQIVPITFPSDGGIVDVREYGAIPDDEGDDTAAIQAALDAYPNGNRIIYLPPGVFLIRDTLRWPAGESGGNAPSLESVRPQAGIRAQPLPHAEGDEIQPDGQDRTARDALPEPRLIRR